MKAKKYKVKFEVEVLDINSVYGVLVDAIRIFENDNVNGEINKTDGDMVKWSTSSEEVTF
jgi:hypothetical protein